MRTEGPPFLAFDLGGTRLKAGLVSVVDGRGEVSALLMSPTGGTIDQALERVADLGTKLLRGQAGAGAGLCMPGIIDEEGVVRSLPGKLAGAEGRDLAGFLRSTFQLEPVVVNDAIAYGAGEAASGAGRGHRRVVVMTIGTGVGVTVFEGGAPVTAGPFGGGLLGGQIPIAEGAGPWLDSNGRPDTIEALCLAERIVDYAREAGATVDGVEGVYAAAAAGEPAARRGIEIYREHLTRAVVALAHAHTPDILVVGGGPMTPGNPLLPGLEDAVNSRLFGAYRTRLAVAQLGDSAALLGLAHLYARPR